MDPSISLMNFPNYISSLISCEYEKCHLEMADQWQHKACETRIY